MEMSIFLAKLLGLYLVIISLTWLVRKDQFESTMKELIGSKSLLILSGELSLFLGLFIAIEHPEWTMDWQGVITVLGYLMILKGITRFAFPAEVKKFASKVISRWSWPTLGFLLLLGIYLTYNGFTAEMPM